MRPRIASLGLIVTDRFPEKDPAAQQVTAAQTKPGANANRRGAPRAPRRHREKRIAEASRRPASASRNDLGSAKRQLPSDLLHVALARRTAGMARAARLPLGELRGRMGIRGGETEKYECQERERHRANECGYKTGRFPMVHSRSPT